jgi:serine protease Do
MASRKTTMFYGLLIAVASLAVGMVLASRLDLSPVSSAQPALSVPSSNSAPLGGPVDASTFRNIAKAVSPSVVNIRTESRQRQQELTEFFGGGSNDLLERFFGGQAPRGGQQQRPQITFSAGTGFLISKDGLILTNNHVVEDATKIEVNLYGDDEDVRYAARVIGRDPLTDSALIELTERPKRELAEVKFGDSAQMAPGDWVMAIGNPFNLAHTVSVGVVSAKERAFQVAEGRSAQVIQTDAAINPGNSGGPLLNLRGEVVGINTAIIADGRQSGNIGIGFAIPINTVRELLPQLRTGKITRGRIGVGVDSIPRDALDEFGLKDRKGAVVRTVSPNSAASKAGLEPGDVILSYNGKPVGSRDELVQMVVATKPGTSVPVRIMRDRQEKTVNVTVEELDLEAEGNVARNRERDDTGQATSTGFGLRLQNISPQDARELKLNSANGALVADVEQGSPAARAGLRPGDVIVRVGREPITSATDAQRELGRVPSRGTAFLRVLREGQETFVSVTKE